MKVSELIYLLQQLENPEEKEIMIRDTAAGNRDVDFIEDCLGFYYVIHNKRPSRRK